MGARSPRAMVKPGQALPADMHTGGASIFHVPLISSARNLANDLSPCHALVTKSINGTVKFPPAFSDGTAVPAYVLGLYRIKSTLPNSIYGPKKG